jgi:hypothetical protein
MVRRQPVTPRRRRLSALVVTVTLLAGPLWAVRPAYASGPDWAAQVASAQAATGGVDLQIAALAGQLEQAQAQTTAADLAETHLENQLDLARADAGAMLAEVYVDDAPGRGLSIPGPYLDAARNVVSSVLDGYRRVLARVRVEQTGAHARLDRMRAIQTRLDDQKRSLDAIVGADQAALERQQSADAAALARSDQARSLASVHHSPTSLVATEAQQRIMANYRFGPLPGGALPAGLAFVDGAVTGVASWYGPGFDGQPTATGAVYNEDEWTAASPWLPLDSLLAVSSGGRSVLLLVNDRGPYVGGRVLDLSHAAALALGSNGLIGVTARVVVPIGGGAAG